MLREMEYLETAVSETLCAGALQRLRVIHSMGIQGLLLSDNNSLESSSVSRPTSEEDNSENEGSVPMLVRY